VHVADRRVPQAQRVDRELGARLGGEKSGNGFRGGRQCDLAVRRAPFGESRDAGTVGAARVFRTGGAPVCAAASAASPKLATGAGNSAIVSRSNQCRTSSGEAPAGSGTVNFSAPLAAGSGKIAGMVASSGGITAGARQVGRYGVRRKIRARRASRSVPAEAQNPGARVRIAS
jgi:hypothetical protein